MTEHIVKADDREFKRIAARASEFGFIDDAAAEGWTIPELLDDDGSVNEVAYLGKDDTGIHLFRLRIWACGERAFLP